MRESAAPLIGVVIILAVLIGGASFFIHEIRQATFPISMTEATTREVNNTHGYSFLYPSEYEVYHYTPQYTAVGHGTPGGFSTRVAVELVESGGGGEYESFDEFLFERGKLLCAADGPGEITMCDQVESNESFVTSAGLSGQKLTFRLINENLKTRQKLISSFGPVYAFNVSTSTPTSAISVLLVYQPLAASSTPTTRELLEDVAQSLTFEKSERR